MSYIEDMAAKAYINQSGAAGSQRLILVDDDKFVTSTDMKNGAYTVAAQPIGPTILSVTATAVGDADTMGIIILVGKLRGETITEEITPVAGSAVPSVYAYDEITSITGSDWEIDAGSQNDTIKVGALTGYAGSDKCFYAIQVVTNTVVASQTNVTGAAVPAFSGFTALIAGNIYPAKCTHIGLTSGEAIGYIANLN